MPSADPIGGEACWVGGWGTTSFEGEVSQSMQSVGQNVFSQVRSPFIISNLIAYSDDPSI